VTGIEVTGLSVDVAASSTQIVHDVSFAVAPGEVLGIVGESGCGKTTVALAVLGGTRAGARITHGAVSVDGHPMLGLSDRELQVRRGRDVAYVSQDPTAALNPSLRIERQLTEMLEVHAPGLDRESMARQLRETLEDVRLPSDAGFLRRYPHQLSGGQQQRVAIAMAAIVRPQAIVMDEPTTGLDVTTQAHILRTVRDLCQKHQVAIVYISHDLAVVGKLADRVLVLYAGRVVEFGPTRVLERPLHPYTRGLVGAIPVISEARALATIPGHLPSPGRHDPGCRFADRCSFRITECTVDEPELSVVAAQHAVRCIRANELRDRPLAASVPKLESEERIASGPLLDVAELSAAYGSTRVLHGVSLQLGAQECVALVGESGSGKTTFGRCVIGLTANWEGRVAYQGEPLARTARKRSRQVRQGLQFIFQSPYNALNPRRTVAESVAAPLSQFFAVNGRERRARVDAALEQVSLSGQLAQRYPDQLSGGERQRVAIARALVCEPQVLICDEITSALDVSVQASIVGLLADLRAERDLAIIFVTHNLALVRSIADRVLVLNAGRIVESGPTSTVLDSPADPYTRALVADTPTLDYEAELVPLGEGEQPP
jgi:peptide/nickel transport system ATP-binding protein